MLSVGLRKSRSIADLHFIPGRVACRGWPLAWMLAGAWQPAELSSPADSLGASQGVWEVLRQPALCPTPGLCSSLGVWTGALHLSSKAGLAPGCGGENSGTQGTVSRLLSTYCMALSRHLPGVTPGSHY